MSKLEKMLKYVSEHNDFYKMRIKEYGIANPLDITQWPILTRKDLQENRYSMFSDGYKSMYFNQQLLHKVTSGSSGIPVNLYWDYCDHFSSAKQLWGKRYIYYGILPTDKYVSFDLHGFETEYTETKINYVLNKNNTLKINVSSIQNDSMFEKAITLINDFNPIWMNVRPSILRKLIELHKDNCVQMTNLKYIESYGEILSDELRNIAENVFKVPVANMYGSEETNAIALECPCRKMHIFNNNVYLEQLNTEISAGTYVNKTLITSITNRAMPLIRYEIGDDIRIDELTSPCGCGTLSPFVSIINGRTLDRIKIGLFELNPILLIEIMGEVNNKFNYILTFYKFKYIKSEALLKCYFKLKKGYEPWREAIIATIKAVFEKRLSHQVNLKIEICYYEPTENLKEKQRILEIIE